MTDVQLVLITGMSGSGKSLALAALEDAGFYCVDNLPTQLLDALVELQRGRVAAKLAVAVDVRSAASLPELPQRLQRLADTGVSMTTVFLDASDDALLRRFSETRRTHPLSSGHGLGGTGAELGLPEAIALERELLSQLREQAVVIDTSVLRPAGLLSQIKALTGHHERGLMLVFESFAFKRGIPLDADYVFDVRMLPNPHYERALRALTGQDPEVAAYLEAQPEVNRMAEHITDFLHAWLPLMSKDHRSYVTVAIGCTGGQHRSVYLVERLSRAFALTWQATRRHRELGGSRH